MPVRLPALVPLVFLVATIVTVAQPLTLGSTREEVMKIVYRESAYADTLARGSVLIEQIRMYPDTGSSRHYNQIIRIASVSMFGVEGYASFVFDAPGRLHAYHWIRGDLSRYAFGNEWKEHLTWRSDVPHATYQAAKSQLDREFGDGRWSDSPEKQFASARWENRSELMKLHWEHGSLRFSHERR